jgi:hypothetical protein
LIINEIMVEATGVELFGVLITRKLLILGTPTTAKKASSPDPLYVYCTKMLFALEPKQTPWRPQYRIDTQRWIEKAPAFLRYRKSPLSISSVHRLAVSITSGLPVIRPQTA